jgi:hypothetical protein
MAKETHSWETHSLVEAHVRREKDEDHNVVTATHHLNNVNE